MTLIPVVADRPEVVVAVAREVPQQTARVAATRTRSALAPLEVQGEQRVEEPVVTVERTSTTTSLPLVRLLAVVAAVAVAQQERVGRAPQARSSSPTPGRLSFHLL